MQPFSGNQRPDLLTSLMNMSLVLHLLRKMHLCRSSCCDHHVSKFQLPWSKNHPHSSCDLHLHSIQGTPHTPDVNDPTPNVPRLPSCLEVLQNPHVLLTSAKVHNPLRLPKSGPNLVCSVHFDFKMFFDNRVHFFDIATSKSGPDLVCFVHFDFEMCFAPQRRALFRHLNFQKCSENGVFCTFWLQNVLRATTACTFSTLQLPKVIRTLGVFNILISEMFRASTACNFLSLIWPAGSAPAALASLLFDPPEPQIIGKTQCFATLLPFRAPGSSFFWDFLFFDLLSSSLLFSSLTLTTSAFHLSILSEVWLLNFLRSVQEVISKYEC